MILKQLWNIYFSNVSPFFCELHSTHKSIQSKGIFSGSAALEISSLIPDYSFSLDNRPPPQKKKISFLKNHLALQANNFQYILSEYSKRIVNLYELSFYQKICNLVITLLDYNYITLDHTLSRWRHVAVSKSSNGRTPWLATINLYINAPRNY